jgi:peroxiredoxin
MLRSGDSAPELAIQTLDGSAVSTGALRGGPIAVAFYKSNCGGCQSALPELAPIFNRYARELPTISVGVGHDTAETLGRFVRDNSLETPVGLDEDRSLRQAWTLFRVPALFLIDGGGRILERFDGYTSELAAAVQQSYEAALGRGEFPDYQEVGGG